MSGCRNSTGPDARAIPLALATFKANPTGSDAREALRTMALAVEGIIDPGERKRSATMLARELAATIREAGPAQKPEVVSTIGYGISDSSTMIAALTEETQTTESRPRTERRSTRPRSDDLGDALAGYLRMLGFEPVAIADFGFGMPHAALASQRHITPNDPVVLGAVREAIAKKGPLKVNQIFDIFDYVVRKIEYLNSSHPTEPRSAAVTLTAKVGDCKCMTVVLASMLEAIGAKTLLITGKATSSKYGHELLGVMVSDEHDDWKRSMHRQAIEGEIFHRYQIFIDLHHMGNRELQFVEVEIAGRRQLYLLLDPTGGSQAVPGKTGRLENAEYYESRPGVPGMMPGL